MKSKKTKTAKVELLRQAKGNQGWTIDHRQVWIVCDLALDMQNVSVEKTEAVMLAMVDAGFAAMEK